MYKLVYFVRKLIFLLVF